MKQTDEVLKPRWPEGLEVVKRYCVSCDDEGDKAVLCVVLGGDGDAHVSVSGPDGFGTGQGGGRHPKVRQALLWLAQAIKEECGDER